MSSLLDQHELHSILNLEGESEEEEEQERLLDYEEHRPHAGTGGSSKLKSRPNVQ